MYVIAACQSFDLCWKKWMHLDFDVSLLNWIAFLNYEYLISVVPEGEEGDPGGGEAKPEEAGPAKP